MREARTQALLDIGRDHAAAARHKPRARQPLGEGRHAGHGLQRIARRDHQPDLIEPQRAQGRQRHMRMPGMGRVEAAAEQADPLPPRIPVTAR